MKSHLLTTPYIIMTMAQGVVEFFLQCKTKSSAKSSPPTNTEILTVEVKVSLKFAIYVVYLPPNPSLLLV